jgi:hypothetical protein
VAAGKIKRFNSRSGLFHEDILKAWLVQTHRFDGARKRLHYVRNEAVAVFDFHSHLAVDRRRAHVKALRDPLGQRLRLGGGLQHHHIAADPRTQFAGTARRHNPSLMQKNETVATRGFFQNVRGEQYRNALLLAQFFHVPRKIAPRGGVEAGGRLIHQQHLGPVQQRLGDLHAAAQSAGERLH